MPDFLCLYELLDSGVALNSGSVFNPFHKLTHISSKITVNGKAVEITPACSACTASVPPIHSSATATAPSSTAQNTRCNTGESNLPPEVILSMTSEPESDDVIKTPEPAPRQSRIAPYRKPANQTSGTWPAKHRLSHFDLTRRFH